MPNIPPLNLDGREDELVRLIMYTNQALISTTGFNPEHTSEMRQEQTEKVRSVVFSCFSTVFGLTPVERYVDLFAQVSKFAEYLAKGHIFFDANKRTTVVLMVAVLVSGGARPNIPDEEDQLKNELYAWIQDLVQDKCSQEELAQILRDGHALTNL